MLTADPVSCTSTTSTTTNEEKEDESNDDFDDEDFVDYNENSVPTTKFPVKPAPHAVPFEPYNMILSKTKVLLTWWKSQKRRIVAQVLYTLLCMCVIVICRLLKGTV